MPKYTIQKGDTLSALAKQYGTTVSVLKKTNKIANVNKIKAGQTIEVPGQEAPPTPQSHPLEYFTAPTRTKILKQRGMNAFTTGNNIGAVKNPGGDTWKGSDPQRRLGQGLAFFYDPDLDLERNQYNGHRAFAIDLLTKFTAPHRLGKKKSTINDLIDIYAPANGENSKLSNENYKKFIRDRLGLEVGDEISWSDRATFKKLMDAIVAFEQTVPIDKLSKEYQPKPGDQPGRPGHEKTFDNIRTWYPNYWKHQEEALDEAIAFRLQGDPKYLDESKLELLQQLTVRPTTTVMPDEVYYGSFSERSPYQYDTLMAWADMMGQSRKDSNAPADLKAWTKAFHPDLPPEMQDEMAEVVYRELQRSGHTVEHMIQPKDTYRSIASEYGISPNQLRRMNGLPLALSEGEDDAELPELAVVGRDYPLVISQPSLQGLFSSLDGIKDFVEAADAYLNGWVDDNGTIDWELADIFQPEIEVVQWIKENDPERFDTPFHTALHQGEPDYNKLLYASVGSPWAESFDSRYHKGRAMADQLDIYKTLMNNNLIAGSDPRYMPDADEEDRGLLENAWSALTAPGDYTRGFLTGDPTVRVTGEELLRRATGIEQGEFDDKLSMFSPHNMGVAAKALAGMAVDIATDPLTWVGGSLAKRGAKMAARNAQLEAKREFELTGRRAFYKAERGDGTHDYNRGAHVYTEHGNGTVLKATEVILPDGKKGQTLEIHLDHKRSWHKPIKAESHKVQPYEKMYGGDSFVAGDVLPVLIGGGVATVKAVGRDKDGFRKITYEISESLEQGAKKTEHTVTGHDFDELIAKDPSQIMTLDEVTDYAHDIVNANLDANGNVKIGGRGKQFIDSIKVAMARAGIDQSDQVLRHLTEIRALSQSVGLAMETSMLTANRYWATLKAYRAAPSGSGQQYKLMHQVERTFNDWLSSEKALHEVFGTEVGRSLEVFSDPMMKASGGRSLLEVLREGGKKISGVEFGEKFSSAEKLAQSTGLIKMAEHGWLRSYMESVYINGMLSSPSTHMTVLVGGQVYLAYSSLEHILKGFVSPIGRAFGKGTGVTPTAAGHNNLGRVGVYDTMAGGMGEGWQMLGTWLSTYASLFSAGKLDPYVRKFAERMTGVDQSGIPSMWERMKKFRQEFYSDGGADLMVGKATSLTSLLNKESTGVIGKAMNVLGTIVKLPTVGIGAIDSVMRWQATEMYARSRGWGEAVEKASLAMREAATKKTPFGKKDFREIVAHNYRKALLEPENISLPTAGKNRTAMGYLKARTLKREAAEYGSYIALADRVSDAFGAGAIMATETLPGKIAWPFFAVAYRSFKQTSERLPGVAFLSKETRDKFKAGGHERDLVIAKQAAGAVLGSAFSYWNLDGTFTGHGPVKPELRRMMGNNWLPHAVRLHDDETGEDTYIAFDKLDPVGRLAGLSATLTEAAGWVDADDARLTDLAAVIIAGFTEALASPILADEMNILSRALADPDKGFKQFQHWAVRKAGALALPYSNFAKRWQRIDAGIQEMAQKPEDELKKIIPGFGTLPAWRNYWGEEVVVPRGWGNSAIGTLMDFISPFPVLITQEGISHIADDDVLKAFSDEYYAPDASPRIFKGIRIPDGWVSRRREIMGKELRLTEAFQIAEPWQEGYTLREMYQLFVGRDKKRRTKENPEGFNLNTGPGRAYAESTSTIAKSDEHDKIPGGRYELLRAIHRKYRELSDEQLAREIFFASNGEVDLNRIVQFKSRWDEAGREYDNQMAVEDEMAKVLDLPSSDAFRVGGY